MILDGVREETMRSFWNDERGTTTIEYTAIAAVISVVIYAGSDLIGEWLRGAVGAIASNLGQ